MHSIYRYLSPERGAEFMARGCDAADFFPHRYYYLPKCGPDGYKLAQRMVGACAPESFLEVVLYAESPALDEFPEELYLDDDVVWHQQHFGRPGQVATAHLAVKGDTLYSLGHVSDLVQRISRRREFKTRVEKIFRGWSLMLLNAVLNYAVEHRLSRVLTPTSELAITHTDRKRHPKLEMFHAIYDKTVLRFLEATPHGGWWTIDMARNRKQWVKPEVLREELSDERTICLCHDIERGLGHTDVDPAFARQADRLAPANLQEMLATEWDEGVKATYCVVGMLLAQERVGIELGGHSLAFHSYDHRITPNGAASDQLLRCRALDYRLKGYRPPQSKLTAELVPENLLTHNFEWLASSRASLGVEEPFMKCGLVRIPIAFDDFALYKEGMGYATWEASVFRYLEGRRFAAFGLHDCYAHHWLPQYKHFIRRLKEFGKLKTFDQVAGRIAFSHAR